MKSFIFLFLLLDISSVSSFSACSFWTMYVFLKVIYYTTTLQIGLHRSAPLRVLCDPVRYINLLVVVVVVVVVVVLLLLLLLPLLLLSLPLLLAALLHCRPA